MPDENHDEKAVNAIEDHIDNEESGKIRAKRDAKLYGKNLNKFGELLKRETKSWTKIEKSKFNEALRTYGKDWSKVSLFIGTKTNN